MPSTATTRNRFEKQASGENANTWGTKVNVVWDMIDACLDGVLDITTEGGTTTLTNADYTADQAKNRVLNCTGTGGTVVIPNANKVYLVRNASSGDVIVQTATPTASATVKAGNEQWVFCNGSASVFLCQVTNFGADNISTTGTISAAGIATAGNATLGDGTADAHTFNGSISVTSGVKTTGTYLIRVEDSGSNVPAGATGIGLELAAPPAFGAFIQGYNRTTNTYAPLYCRASEITFDIATAAICVVTSTGFAVTGVLTVTGNVTLGDADTDAHTVNGTLKLQSYTVASLPAAGTVGRTAFVTDANATTFASVVAGGGANGVPVYDDGTNWRIG